MSCDLISLPLSDIAKFKYGKTIRKQDIEDEGQFPVHSGYTTVGYLSNYMYEEPQLMIVCRGAGGTGDIKMSPPKVSITNLAIVITCDESKVCKDYLYWVLKLADTYSLRTGSAQPQITINSLDSFNVVIHRDLSTQRTIADFLNKLNLKIGVNTETNRTLEQMAQAIFKSWFVDFDPVKAKMNGEQPEGMDAATASLFPEKLVESELGLIPDGWEVTKLSKVIDLLNGFAFKSPDYVKEGTFVLRTKNFDSSNSVERLGDDVYLPDEFLESHKKYLCEAYDYHVVMVAASIGKTAMIYPHQLPALRNQNMWCFRPKDESLRFYTKYMVDGLVKLNMGLASGSARAFFKKGDFNSYEFALPSSELLNKFNDVVGNLVKQKGSLLNQNVQLAAMRDTLLPKLLSGEIELGQAQELVEVE
ncbi:TPA: restriction endonuclease subunit S [Vibrio parahaemolyticus]|nr:restriction endonuclease subunit S [Vibrio parahaemolyticus]